MHFIIVKTVKSITIKADKFRTEKNYLGNATEPSSMAHNITSSTVSCRRNTKNSGSIVWGSVCFRYSISE
jgi:hypothetical protein